MTNRYSREPNLMGYYFLQYHQAFKVLEQLRLSALVGKRQKLDDSLVQIARREMTAVAKGFDKIAYPVAQDLNYFALQNQNSRVILLIGGTFLGAENKESTIGFDLGNDPWRIFKRDPVDSIDTRVTVEKAEEFLESQSDMLKANNFAAFQIKSGRFFYLSNSALSRFESADGVDFVSLIPLLSYTPHVGITAVEKPSYRVYKESVPVPFFSYRLKKSSEPKLRKKLSYKTIDEEEMIHDWLAYRIVVETEQEARELHHALKLSPRIGKLKRTLIEFISCEDYYAAPKPNGYKAFNDVFRVSTKWGSSIIEVQIVDKAQYYKNEVDNDDPCFHSNQEKKKRPGKQFRLSEADISILRKLCGDSTIPLLIR